MSSVDVELKKILSMTKYKGILILQFFATLTYLLFRGGTSSNIVFNALSVVITVFVPLVIFMLSSDLFANEIQTGEIKNLFYRPVKKGNFYFYKNIAILIYVIFIMAVTFLLSSIFIIINGFQWTYIISLFISYAVSLVPMCAIVVFAATTSIFTKNSALSVFLNTIIYTSMVGLNFFYPKVGMIFFTSYVGWYKSFANSNMLFGNIVLVSMILGSYIIAFSTLGKKQMEDLNV